MKQTNYSALRNSPFVEGMVSDVIVGALTGLTTVRRLILRIIFFVVIIVATISFTTGMLFRDYLPDKPAPTAQPETPGGEPAKSLQPRTPTHERDVPGEFQQLIRTNPL